MPDTILEQVCGGFETLEKVVLNIDCGQIHYSNNRNFSLFRKREQDHANNAFYIVLVDPLGNSYLSDSVYNEGASVSCFKEFVEKINSGKARIVLREDCFLVE